jgi:YegS/Rv2252/BmrU family lipid kinase
MYHIIANSNSVSGKNSGKLEQVKSVFARAGIDIEIHVTEHAGHAKEIAHELTESGEHTTLIAMGGDGTLHEVFNGIVDVEKCDLGVIPVGTGNDFAAAVNIPDDAKRAAEIIAFKAPSPMDYIELTNGLRSINAVGSGMDVDILKRTYASKKKSKGKYYASFVKSLFNYKSNPFTVIYDGKEEKHNGLLACLGNGTQIGGGIKIFPNAKVDDGYIDLFIVDYLSKPRTLYAFLNLLLGRLDRIKEVTQVKCKKVTFIPDGELTTIQAEGELYDGMQLDAELVSGKLKFYLP